MIVRDLNRIAAMLPGIKVTGGDMDFVFETPNSLFYEFLPYWQGFKGPAGIVYREKNYDCNKFADTFRTLMWISTARQNLPGSIGVATIIVKQTDARLGIPAGNLHALNLVGVESDGGVKWHVIEPQTGLHETLENYPNHIVSAAF